MDNQVLDIINTENENSKNTNENAKKLFSRIGMILTILIVMVQLFEAIIYIIVNEAAPNLRHEPWIAWAIIALGYYLTAFPIYCLLMKRIPNTPREEPKAMRVGEVISLFFIGMASLYIFNFLSQIINGVISSIKGSAVMNPLAAVVSSSNVWYSFLFIGIIAPIIEEFIFRGILLDKLRGYGSKNAIWFSAIIFGLYHLNTSQFFYATALGTILAYAAIKTSQIKYSIILHMCINIMGGVVAPLLASTGYLRVVGAMVIVVIVIGIILFMIMKRRIASEKIEQSVIYEVSKKTVYGNPGVILYIGLCVALIIIMTIF